MQLLPIQKKTDAIILLFCKVKITLKQNMPQDMLQMFNEL